MAGLFALFFSLNGRIGRAGFWLGLVLVILAGTLLSAVLVLLGFGESQSYSFVQIVDDAIVRQGMGVRYQLSPWVNLILWTLLFVPLAVVGIKRRRDRDHSGLDVVAFLVLAMLMHMLVILGAEGVLMFLAQIPLVVWGSCLLIYMGLLRGTTGPNRYGRDPLEHSAMRAASAP